MALHLETIPIKAFREILSRYPSTVPTPLKDLDVLRYDTIPAQLAQAPKDAYLEKASVESLVEWKLKHGTFRPQLLALVKSNDAATVRESTLHAFHLVRDASPTSHVETALAALKLLTALRGIGPATASLLLSVAAPGVYPFFSDELFRWCVWSEEVKGKGTGWARKIAYSVKEYKVVVEKVQEVRERLGVQAVEVERVAWVLGKEGVDLDVDGGELGGEGKGEASNDAKKEAEEREEVVQEEKKKVPTKGTKRKVEDAALPAPGSRRSTRSKK